jgi:hypothetical protein
LQITSSSAATAEQTMARAARFAAATIQLRPTKSATGAWLGAGEGMGVKNAIKSSSYGITRSLSAGNCDLVLFEIKLEEQYQK